MKCYRILILALLIPVLLMAAAEAQTTTVMMYICGTDLQSDAVKDIQEMCDASFGSDVNVVVAAGGAKSWDNRKLKGGVVNLFTVSGHKLTNVKDMGKKNMGDPSTLKWFAGYCLDNYPADRTILILWDHGGGAGGGVCYDELFRDDYLTLPELHQAFSELKSERSFHLDILGMDACLMATYETAAIASEVADYFVASEELEPEIGWYYTPWLNALGKNSGIGNEELCRSIVDAYMEAGLEYDSEEFLTLSAIRLSAMPKLIAAMETFAGYLGSGVQMNMISTITRQRQRMYAFGDYYDSSSDMVDLGTMVNAYAGFSNQAASDVLSCLDDAVVCSRKSSSIPAACGLSVLLPMSNKAELASKPSIYNLSFAIPGYVDFAIGYAKVLCGQNYVFTAGSTTQLTAADMSSQTFTDALSSYGEIPSFIAGSGGTASSPSSSASSSAASSSGSVPSFIAGSANPGPSDTGSASQTGSDGFSLSGAIASLAQLAPQVQPESDLAFSMTLSAEDMEYLSYVEGRLLMDVSDDELTACVDLGYMQNAWIDWNNNTVYSLFDGTWPTLAGQMVPMYDQAVTQQTRRSLIPVTVNGKPTYLLVVFQGDSKTGKVIGYSEGFDDNGRPVRGYSKLENGDVIIPEYTLYYCDPDAPEDTEMDEETFEGDAITWEGALEVTYEPIESDADYLFCFILNDIYGDYQECDSISFTR